MKGLLISSLPTCFVVTTPSAWLVRELSGPLSGAIAWGQIHIILNQTDRYNSI
jgi:hypothetical protein